MMICIGGVNFQEYLKGLDAKITSLYPFYMNDPLDTYLIRYRIG